MRRKLFHLAAGLSLAMCVAVCALWVRSYSLSEEVEHDNGVHAYEVRTGWGSVSFTHVIYTRARPREWPWQYGRRAPEYPRLIADERYWHFSFSNTVGRFAGIVVPFAAPALLLATLPMWWLMSWMRSRRNRSSGCCLSCGYDLRATPKQ